MNLLFIDTSQKNLRVGVMLDDKVLYQNTLLNITSHSIYLVNEINMAFNSLKISLDDIDKILVVVGPGSFTGIRIGLTVSKVMAWSKQIPIVSVSALKASAISSNFLGIRIISLKDKENLYLGVYSDNLETIIEDMYVKSDFLESYLSVLDNPYTVIDVQDGYFDIPKVMNYYKNFDGENAHGIKPNYLKELYYKKVNNNG